MRGRLPACIAAVLPLMAACSQLGGETAACSGPEATQLVGDILRDSVQDATRETLGERSEPGTYSTSRIRATVGQLRFAIADARTTKDDPDSTKYFCTGLLKVSVPVDVVQSASRARSAAELSSLAALADENGLERAANAFTREIEYSLQPTDEGDKIYAETDVNEQLVGFLSEVLASHLLSSKIEQQALAQSRVEAEERALAAQAERESASALTEQKQAVLGEVRAENSLARQTIDAIWTSVPKESWGPILELQRAWVRRKDADCKVEAASASIDPAEKEAARLRCDTRLTVQRISWLRQNQPALETEMDSEPEVATF